MNEKLFKILDCNRKDILGLPSGAVHLWFCFYMHESEHQESYLSLNRIEAITGMSRKTIIRWREFLIEGGWLLAVGATAADRYSNPTRGANKVLVMRVNDPIKGGIGKTTPPEGSEEIPSTGGVENLHHPKIPPKVYGYGSSYGSRSGCSSVPLRSVPLHGEGTSSSTPSSLRSETEEPKAEPTATPKAEPTTKPKTPAFGAPDEVKSKTKHHPNYDEPFPFDFNEWSVQARAEWSDAHAVNNKLKASAPAEKREVALPVEPETEKSPKIPPPKAAPPPAPVPTHFDGEPTTVDGQNAIHAVLDEPKLDSDAIPPVVARPSRAQELRELKESAVARLEQDWLEHWETIKSTKLLNDPKHEHTRLNDAIEKDERRKFNQKWESEEQNRKLRAIGLIA